jgi:hypothetical protein
LALATWLPQHYAATEPGLHNVRMLRVEATRDPSIASAAFDYGSPLFQGRASLVAVRRGDVATLFIAAAARACFADHLPALLRVLGSVRVTCLDPTCQTGVTPLELTHLLRIGAELPDPT